MANGLRDTARERREAEAAGRPAEKLYGGLRDTARSKRDAAAEAAGRPAKDTLTPLAQQRSTFVDKGGFFGGPVSLLKDSPFLGKKLADGKPRFQPLTPEPAGAAGAVAAASAEGYPPLKGGSLQNAFGINTFPKSMNRSSLNQTSPSTALQSGVSQTSPSTALQFGAGNPDITESWYSANAALASLRPENYGSGSIDPTESYFDKYTAGLRGAWGDV